jgi:hypothetical protein
MGTDGVVDCFPVAERAIDFFHFQGTRRDLVELFGMSTVGALDGAVEFGRTRSQHEQMQRRCWQASSNSAENSERPSTCTARMGKGMRCCRVSDLGTLRTGCVGNQLN